MINLNRRQDYFGSWFQNLHGQLAYGFGPVMRQYNMVGACGRAKPLTSWWLGSKWARQDLGPHTSSDLTSRAHHQWPHFLYRVPPPQGSTTSQRPPAEDWAFNTWGDILDQTLAHSSVRSPSHGLMLQTAKANLKREMEEKQDWGKNNIRKRWVING